MAHRKRTQAKQATLGNELLERMAAGQSITKAATEMGIPRSTAHFYYQAALKRASKETEGLRGELVQQELETLRQLIEAHMPLARDGDEKSANVVLRASNQRSKLLGLEEALKVEVQTNRVDDALNAIISIIDSGREEDHEALKLLRPSASDL